MTVLTRTQLTDQTTFDQSMNVSWKHHATKRNYLSVCKAVHAENLLHFIALHFIAPFSISLHYTQLYHFVLRNVIAWGNGSVYISVLCFFLHHKIDVIFMFNGYSIFVAGYNLLETGWKNAETPFFIDSSRWNIIAIFHQNCELLLVNCGPTLKLCT